MDSFDKTLQGLVNEAYKLGFTQAIKSVGQLTRGDITHIEERKGFAYPYLDFKQAHEAGEKI